MGMGVPVVATSVSAIPEAVEAGSSGLLVPPGNPPLLADALQSMLTDPGLRRRVIAAARERVSRDFDNRAQIGQLAALLKDAL
jgi:glycosyltransferase involved in cell wall biosynthesis